MIKHHLYSSLKKIFFFYLLNFKKSDMYEDIVENRKLVILNLHKISPEENPFYPSLSPKLFEELLKFITKEFNVITFAEIEEYRNSTKPNLILSFDDGFYDFTEYAVPLMEKYGVSANQNIIPSCVETGLPVWDVMLGDFLNVAPIKLVNEMQLDGFSMKLTTSNQVQYGLALTQFLKMRSMTERKRLWREIEEAMQKVEVPFTRMLTAEEIKSLSKDYEIGAHSYSHESMGIESDDFFKEDFQKCKRFFDVKLWLPLDIYAFPSGSYKNHQFNYLRDSGVRHILLVDEEYATYGRDVYPRFTFYGDSVSEVKMRALGWTR